MKRVAILSIVFIMVAIGSSMASMQDDKDFRAGLKYYNSKNYKAAVKHFREYLSKKPDPRGYYLAGYALYKIGKFNESEECFREAFLIDPEFSLEKAGLLRQAALEKADKAAPAKKQAAPEPEKKETKPEAKQPAAASEKKAEPKKK